MDSIPDSDFLTEQEKEDARKETNVEFIKAYNARSFNYPKAAARKSAKDIQAFAEDKLVAKSFTEMRCELPGAPRSTFLMVFSPDGTKVASTHGNHNIYVSDVRTGKNIKTLMGHPRTPWCIAFHPTSNQIIASGCLGGQVRIWDLSGGSEVWSSDNSTVIASLTFHPEDRLLVIATYNQLHFWDWSKPVPFATVSTATTKEKVRYVAFDPLGHKLVTGISNNTTPQSRWERAQRCPTSSLLISPRFSEYSPITSPTPPPHRPMHHTSYSYSPASPPEPPRTVTVRSPQPQSRPSPSQTPSTSSTSTQPTGTSLSAGLPSPFSNIPPYTGRSQRARLTSRILAHYRAFPPRSGPDAHLYRNIFAGRGDGLSVGPIHMRSLIMPPNDQRDVTMVSSAAAEGVEPDLSNVEIFAAVRDPRPSSSMSSPSTTPINQFNYSVGNRTEPLIRLTLESTTPNELVNRAIEFQQPAEERRRQNTVATEASSANSQQQQVASESRSSLPPTAPSRREPLSSVPDRERRISACYRNLVLEYEQLVQRYLQIYRPPVMIDRGTDPMDLGYPTPRLSAGLVDPHQPSTSTSRVRTNQTPRSIIQPLSSNSINNPTDMRSVCEFTTTDPSVLSPLRNQEVEAARRSSSSSDFNVSTRRQLDLEGNRRQFRGGYRGYLADVPPDLNTNQPEVAENAEENTSESQESKKMSVMLKTVEKALKTFRDNDENSPSTSKSAKVVKTYNRSSNQQNSVANEAVSVSANTILTENPQETTEINLQSTNLNETNQQQVVDATSSNGDNNSNQQDEVNDLITNLSIISSMAVQLKSVAERLTLHKDNEEKNKVNQENLSENDAEVAGPSNSTTTVEQTNESCVVDLNESAANNETPNVAADIKLAKKMVDKIVEIMNTFSSQSCNNQPSSSNQEEASKSRKRPYISIKNKGRKPMLVLSSSDSSNSSDNDDESPKKQKTRSQEPSSSEDNIEAQQVPSDSNNVNINDNASDTTSASMYNNVAADDIASTSDFAERRPWNYNRELEQLVTDLLHDNNDSNPEETNSNSTVNETLLCSVCGDSLGTCTPTLCRNNQPLESSRSGTQSERRRRFFCHRLSAFHPTRVQTRFRNQRIRYSLANRNYMQSFNLLPQQDSSLDEVINFSQRSSEEIQSDNNQPVIEPSYPSYHPFDPPPELDTINPEHIGIGNMYSNIVQELETSLSDIRNIQSQRRLGETSDVLSHFSERLESIMTQSRAILRNLSTSIEVLPGEQNNGENSQQRTNGNSTTAPNTWSSSSSPGDVISVASPSSLSTPNRSPAVANPQSVNADHSYPRPTSNMSPLMASLHLTVSHIWRQARLLRTQMDSIERIDRAMLELAQLRVMRQMFADLCRYFSVGGAGSQNVGAGHQQQDAPRHNRASNAPDRNTASENTVTNEERGTATNSTISTGSVPTPSFVPSNTAVSSMRRMMAGTRISDNTTESTRISPSSTTTSHSSTTTTTSHRPPHGSTRAPRRVYPCVLVMHPRNSRRYPSGASAGLGGGGVRLRGCGGSRARYLASRRNVFRQMGGLGMGGMSMVDVAAPGRARNYMNLLNPDTFPSLSHRLEHYLIEHGRLIGRRPTTNQATSPRIPSPTEPPTPSSSSSTNNGNASSATSAERALTMRLNNCRMRMHRLFGGRTQYSTNANTGPQSLVSRDGASRYNARHTLCIMLDTLSRFMEVYGTGLVGISGSFRTYLREVIDLSRLLSEVLLLQIVDAIPPPTGMMLDPERENLAQRIEQMCSRMIVTRLSSQSGQLTRSLRLMRLNVRFFSHSINQNRLLEERFSSNSQLNSQSNRLNQSDIRRDDVSSADLLPPPYSVPNPLSDGRLEYAWAQPRDEFQSQSSTPSMTETQLSRMRLNEIRARPSQPRHQPPVPPSPATAQQNIPSTVDQSLNSQSSNNNAPATSSTTAEPQQQIGDQNISRLDRLDSFFAHLSQYHQEAQQQRQPQQAMEQQQQQQQQGRDSVTRGVTNMSELLYQRFGLDGAEVWQRVVPRVVVPQAEVSAADQHVVNNPSTAPRNPIVAYLNSSLQRSANQQPSAATTENQRFLDSLPNPNPSSNPNPNDSTSSTRPPTQQNQTNTPTSNSTARNSRENRVQQQQLQLQQQRRLYMRSNSSNGYEHGGGSAGGTSGPSGSGTSGGGVHVSGMWANDDVFDDRALRFVQAERMAMAIREVGLDTIENRGGLPMYYRNNPMWNVPDLHLNNQPLPSSGRDQDSVYHPRNHRFLINRDLLDEQLILHRGGPRHAHAPIFSRPRFLHPLYSWNNGHVNGVNSFVEERDGVDADRPEARGGGEQVYESDIIAAVTPNHRIQVWEFNKMGEGHGIIPNITNALKNVVVSECKIHNDASVDIASDGSVLVTLLPSNSYLNITNRLGIYSLEWQSLGQILYITTFDQNAVSVSLSPLSRHLVVGLASRRVSIMPTEQWTLARIFLLDGRRMAFGRLSLMKEIEQSRDTNFVMSVNCIRWLPTSGQGLVFATNTGQLRILN